MKGSGLPWEGYDMYVTKVVASSASLATFVVFVLDAGDTLYGGSGKILAVQIGAGDVPR